MSSQDRLAPFREALRGAVHERDWVGLATVPALVLGIFALPEGVRESLQFAYREPTLVTAYTSHFVHFEASHLAANLLGYVLLAGGGYVLAALADCRRLYGVSATTYLLVFPPVLSALNLAVPRNAVGYGFSGLNMAFAGLLGLVLVAYGSRIDGRVRVRHAPGVFFLGVTVVSLAALPDGPVALVLAAVSASLVTAYGLSAHRAWRQTRQPRIHDVPAGWFDAGILGAVTFLGYQVIGFPAPTADGQVVNLYVHLLGFCLGFVVPYAAVATGVVDADASQGFLSA